MRIATRISDDLSFCRRGIYVRCIFTADNIVVGENIVGKFVERAAVKAWAFAMSMALMIQCVDGNALFGNRRKSVVETRAVLPNAVEKEEHDRVCSRRDILARVELDAAATRERSFRQSKRILHR